IGVFTKHLLESPVPPHVRRPDLDIPKSVSALVIQALEKDPSKRPPTALAFQKALVDALAERGQSELSHLLSQNPAEHLSDDAEAATRSDVEEYERRLRRRSHVALALAALLACGLVAGGVTAYRRMTAPRPFDGLEVEPNDAASQARTLPFGATVLGKVGKRIDRERSDRDFYRVEVPAGTRAVRLSTTALPNMAICTWVY